MYMYLCEVIVTFAFVSVVKADGGKVHRLNQAHTGTGSHV